MNHRSSASLPGNLPTLDLHGCRQTTAISRATTFLHNVAKNHANSCRSGCQCSVQCIIVTGSGSHSHDGPILRRAISKLLTKRRMAHFITPHSGRGSFTVDANSGVELYWDERRVDSKVIVQPRDGGATAWPDLPSITAARAKEAGGRRRAPTTRPHDPSACFGLDGRQLQQLQPLQQRGSSSTNISDGDEQDEVIDVFPLPSEVAADDAVLSRIKKLSNAEATAHRGNRMREENLLQRAMVMSAQEQQQMEEMEGNEMEQIERVMELSRRESSCTRMGMDGEEDSCDDVMGDEEFEKLLEASRLEEMERRKEDQEELERALRISEEEIRATKSSNEEEDEELKRALSLSMLESRKNHQCAPANDDENDEEDEIQKAIRESLAMAAEDSAVGIDGIEGDGRIGDEEAEMIRQAMELSVQAEEERKMVERVLNKEEEENNNNSASDTYGLIHSAVRTVAQIDNSGTDR